MKKRRKLKKKFVVFLLIYFILLTSYLTSFTFAKFVGRIEKETSLEIAKWEVYTDTNDNSTNALNLVSGNTSQNYILKVTSNSDVAIDYSVEISNLPNGIIISLDGGTFKTAKNNKIVFEDAGSFAAGSASVVNQHNLTFSTVLGSGNISSENIKINVIFIQNNVEVEL